jgi:cell division protein FtsB
MAKHRYVLKPRAKLIIALVVMGYFVVSIIQQELKIQNQYVEMDSLKQQIQEVEDLNMEMERQIEYTKSEEYVEKVARESFGWVKEGEIKFIEKKN